MLSVMRINPDALRTVRTDRGVSQRELADLVGCRRPHIANVEAGRRGASPTLIRQFAAALHVSVLTLLGPDDRSVSDAE